MQIMAESGYCLHDATAHPHKSHVPKLKGWQAHGFRGSEPLIDPCTAGLLPPPGPVSHGLTGCVGGRLL
jgi:hypothetical protein